MKKNRPCDQPGYWQAVAGELLRLAKKNPTLVGEAAFHIARAKVDEAFGQPLLELELVK